MWLTGEKWAGVIPTIFFEEEKCGCWLRILCSSSADIKWHLLGFTFLIGFNAGAAYSNEHQNIKQNDSQQKINYIKRKKVNENNN
jgi:hypothetical protein